MKLPSRAFALLIIVILITAVVYLFFIQNEEEESNDKDIQAPQIIFVTGNTTGYAGKYTTITARFSDNKAVTTAVLYYKPASASSWNSQSILNGTVDIIVPQNSKENLYYYIVVNDAAGNGPVGKPSTDGSKYYIITVSIQDEEVIHTVFIEEATATSCQYCPTVGKIIHDVYTSGKYRFYYVSLVEDKNTLANTRLNTEYNLYGKPTIFIDGGYTVIMGANHKISTYEEAIQKALNRNVPNIKITIDAAYDTNTKKLHTRIHIYNMDTQPYAGRLRVYLTEIVSRFNDYNGKPYRYALYDYIINEDFTITAQDQLEKSKSMDISDLDPDNLMLFAAVFNSQKQNAYSDPPTNSKPFDAYYVDAVNATRVIEGGNLPPEVGIIVPEQGKIYVRGNQRLQFLYKNRLLKNTWLLGKAVISIHAHDDSAVSKVEIYLNDKLVVTLTSESLTWSTEKVLFKEPFRPKKYTITVKAYDDTNKTSTASMTVWAWLAF